MRLLPPRRAGGPYSRATGRVTLILPKEITAAAGTGVGGMWSLSGIGLATNLDGRLELMAVATNPGEPNLDVLPLTGLWRRWERLEGGWSDWESFGPVIHTSGVLPQTPAMAPDLQGCLWAVGTADQGQVWAVAQRHPGYAWHGWIELGQPITEGELTAAAVLGTTSDGRLEVFVSDLSGDVWRRQAGAGHQWHEVGHPGDGPTDLRLAVAPKRDRRLELLATAEGYAAVWHCSERRQGGWSPWKLLGTPAKHVITSAPVAAQNKDGRLEVFIIAGDHGVWHCQERPEGDWSPLVPMDQAVGATSEGLVEVAAGSHADGRLVLFANAVKEMPSDPEFPPHWGTLLYCREQTTPGGHWSDWERVDVPYDEHGGDLILQSLALSMNADGKLELFAAIKDTTSLCRFRQSSTSGSDWVSERVGLTPPPSPPAPVLSVPSVQ